MAASTVELLRALELEQPDVLGFSLGAMVALAMAAEFSGELGAVVSGGRKGRQQLRDEIHCVTAQGG